MAILPMDRSRNKIVSAITKRPTSLELVATGWRGHRSMVIANSVRQNGQNIAPGRVQGHYCCNGDMKSPFQIEKIDLTICGNFTTIIYNRGCCWTGHFLIMYLTLPPIIGGCIFPSNLPPPKKKPRYRFIILY